MNRVLFLFLMLFMVGEVDGKPSPNVYWQEVPLSEIDDENYVGEFGDFTDPVNHGLIIKKVGDKFEIRTTEFTSYDENDYEVLDVFLCNKDRARLRLLKEIDKRLYLYLDCERTKGEGYFHKPYIQLVRETNSIFFIYHGFGKKNFEEYNCNNVSDKINCPTTQTSFYGKKGEFILPFKK